MPWSKESRQSRGYGTEWVKIRKLVIDRAKGLCEECQRCGEVAMGRDVDHVVSKADAAKRGWTQAQTDALSNLQYLCKRHHLEKSAREQGRTYREKIQIGVDGWPVDG